MVFLTRNTRNTRISRISRIPGNPGFPGARQPRILYDMMPRACTECAQTPFGKDSLKNLTKGCPRVLTRHTMNHHRSAAKCTPTAMRSYIYIYIYIYINTKTPNQNPSNNAHHCAWPGPGPGANPMGPRPRLKILLRTML